MTIKYFKGDAIDALLRAQLNEDVGTYLIHCCNAQGVMGSGIAKAIKERIPAAYTEYKHYIDTVRNCGGNPMGHLTHADNVINLVAQENYGRGKRQVHYGYLAKALQRTSTMFSSYGMEARTLIVPYKMCCDRAGGDWDVVVELLEAYFEGWNVEVYSIT